MRDHPSAGSLPEWPLELCQPNFRNQLPSRSPTWQQRTNDLEGIFCSFSKCVSMELDWSGSVRSWTYKTWCCHCRQRLHKLYHNAGSESTVLKKNPFAFKLLTSALTLLFSFKSSPKPPVPKNVTSHSSAFWYSAPHVPSLYMLAHLLCPTIISVRKMKKVSKNQEYLVCFFSLSHGQVIQLG